MDKLEKLSEIEFSDEAEKEAIKLAAYSIIKVMFAENLVTESELNYIHDKYEIPVE